MSKRPQMIFVIYAARSGSTFLSSVLDAVPNVGVSIEGQYLGELLLRTPTIKTDEDVDKVISVLAADPSFAGWELDRAQLRRNLLSLPRPAEIEEIFRRLMSQFFNNDDLDYYVFKGIGPGNIGKARNLFKNSKFVHILRDPRAVYNSQKKSFLLDNPNLPFANNAFTFARRWRLFVDYCNRAAGADLIEVRYEDLVSDFETTIERLCAFFAADGLPAPDLQKARTASGSSYFEKVPKEQKHLHGNVKAGTARTDRIAAWRSELSDAEVHWIQILDKVQMERYGYEPVEFPSSRDHLVKMLGYCGLGSYRWCVNKGHRAGFLLSNPAFLRRVIVRKTSRYIPSS